MAKVDVVVVEEPEEEPRKPLSDALQKVMLAGIGALALAQDTAEDLVARMVERGEIAEEDGKRLIREMGAKRKEQAEKAATRAADMESRMQEVLARMNVPTKSDIDALGDKVTELTKKIDELSKES